MSYDAFISYSHSADGQLAPAVQRGLQKMAKPWHRRRALHVFRDDTGLSANPALWQSIENALDDSRWFLLFLSPTAAKSEWVAREINRWRESKPASQLLPILTEGELHWDEALNDFDPVKSTAYPAALAGFFAMEPRHLDLRWAKNGEQLDLGNSAFRSAIADLAAPIHGMDKEDLEGEDVRLQKRARRLARGAVAALTLLLIAAIGAGLLAFDNARKAEAERDRAVVAEAEAQSERDRALAAEQDAVEAESQAQAERAAAQNERDRAVAAEAEATASLERALAAEETAAAEAERARREALRAERASLCDRYGLLVQIEDRRVTDSALGLTQTDSGDANRVEDGNRNSLINNLWWDAESLGLTGLDLVAIEAMFNFPIGYSNGDPLPEDPNEYFESPYSMPAFERDYPVGAGEGPEGAYDYYDGFVSLTYQEVLEQLDAGVGSFCREAGVF